MIDWSSCEAVGHAADLVSGAWVFRGIRVVSALFENLEDGGSVAQFIEWFPGVQLAQGGVLRQVQIRPQDFIEAL